jgi:DNA-binding response OmpR family regulator
VLDWMSKGLEVAPPALIITSRSGIADAVAGLDAGADDFLVKPVDELLLLARINAVLRRTYPEDRSSPVVTLAGATFDAPAATVTIHGQAVSLTAKEFDLALAFFKNRHRPLSRTYLLETVWGRNPDVPTRTLDAHVSRIRLKLGLRRENGFRLAPVYSYGYRLEVVLDEHRP